jgi:hypothetical protein
MDTVRNPVLMQSGGWSRVEILKKLWTLILFVFADAGETVHAFWHEHFKAGTVLEFSRFFNCYIGNRKNFPGKE